MANIIEGKKLANEVKIKFMEDKRLLSLNAESFIAILMLGENTSSDIYIRNKTKFGEEVGIKVNLFKYKYSGNTSDDESTYDKVKSKIQVLNNDKNCLGMIFQSPLPESFSYSLSEVCDLISPSKDLDCLTSVNLGRIWNNTTYVLPATVKAVVKILEEISKNESVNSLNEFLKGKNVVIVNHTIILGRPLAGYLLNHEATVTLCHKYTKDLATHIKGADILITGTGVKGLIKADMVKDGAIVIDAGISKDESSDKIYGDVDFELVSSKAKYITPVPGGVGPMTVSSLFDNLFDLNIKK